MVRVPSVARWDTTGEKQVIGKAYFVRQAAILFRFAKATSDPKISAAALSYCRKYWHPEHRQPADDNERANGPGGYFKFFFRRVVAHSTPQLAASFISNQACNVAFWHV